MVLIFAKSLPREKRTFAVFGGCITNVIGIAIAFLADIFLDWNTEWDLNLAPFVAVIVSAFVVFEYVLRFRVVHALMIGLGICMGWVGLGIFLGQPLLVELFWGGSFAVVVRFFSEGPAAQSNPPLVPVRPNDEQGPNIKRPP